ncbi:MAG: glucan biosynthesis protein [Syntrophobacteraceae bacterium]
MVWAPLRKWKLSPVFLLIWFPAFLTSFCTPHPPPKMPFGYEDAIAKAKLLAQNPFQQPPRLPEPIAHLDYDQWKQIRFKPEDALWRKDKLPFHVEFFHLGWLFNHPVQINVVQPGGILPVKFTPQMFTYGKNKFDPAVLKDLGFAGFRLHYPLNTPSYYDEFAVFLGASYFRAVGKNEDYGLSARALAIDTALPTPEEFPFFKEFWLVRPEPKSTAVTIYALLDSPSVSGACKFVIQPGKATLFHVATTLFFRKPVQRLGIAPLTSMFFFGKGTNCRPDDDFRPQVHDSDGLEIANSTGEWIWRPLINPENLLVTSFELTNPVGFGLFQRDVNFADYQDLEAQYQKRPSAWIVPDKGWGKGRVELVEIPSNAEKYDNIVSYWVPEDKPLPGKPVSFSYEIKWGPPETAEPPFGRVIATRTGAGVGKQQGTRMYLIDFKGGELDTIPPDATLQADLSAGGGKIVEHYIVRNNYIHGWRLVINVRKAKNAPNSSRPIELRAALRLGDRILTETWSYIDPNP